MARAALSRRALDGPNVGKLSVQQGDLCLLFGGYAGHLWPVQTQLAGPFRRAKNGPSKMRRSAVSRTSIIGSFKIFTPAVIGCTMRVNLDII